MNDNPDTRFRCTICGQVGAVGRCCGNETREPMNDLARDEARNHHARFWRGPGGSLLCDREIPGVTQRLDDASARNYGGQWLVGETLTRSACEFIAVAMGGVMDTGPSGRYPVR